MTDTSLFYAINGLAGKVPFFDRFFQGISDDYFSLVLVCLVLVWMWFSINDSLQRRHTQKGIILALISMGMAEALVKVCTAFYFRARPFNALPQNTVHLLFYKPHDYSFPSSFTATIFGLSLPILFTSKKYGIPLIIIALLSSFGRIYIGIHYPLDILGGIGFAAAGYLVAIAIMRLFKPLIDTILKILQSIYLA